MTKKLNVVSCPSPRRARGAAPCGRPLAWLEVDVAGSVVVARTVGGGREHRTMEEGRFPTEELRGRLDEDQEPFGQFGVPVACGCGDRYSVDVVAVLEGRHRPLTKADQDTTDYRDLGVSFDK